MPPTTFRNSLLLTFRCHVDRGAGKEQGGEKTLLAGVRRGPGRQVVCWAYPHAVCIIESGLRILDSPKSGVSTTNNNDVRTRATNSNQSVPGHVYQQF